MLWVYIYISLCVANMCYVSLVHLIGHPWSCLPLGTGVPRRTFTEAGGGTVTAHCMTTHNKHTFSHDKPLFSSRKRFLTTISQPQSCSCVEARVLYSVSESAPCSSDTHRLPRVSYLEVTPSSPVPSFWDRPRGVSSPSYPVDYRSLAHPVRKSGLTLR